MWPRSSVRTAARRSRVRPGPSGSSGNRMRPGSRPPAVVEIRATPMIRSPKSSGCCSASEMMLMPPIECPTSTTRVRARLLDDAPQVVAELLDGGVLRRSSGPSGRASAGRRRRCGSGRGSRPLEVPAVQVERVAVDEDDRQLVGRRARGTSSTSACRSMPSSVTTLSGGQRREPKGVSSPAPRRAITRRAGRRRRRRRPAGSRPARPRRADQLASCMLMRGSSCDVSTDAARRRSG